MVPRIRVTASSALAIVLAGCVNVAVTTDYDRAADFSKYRTYAWAPGPPADHQSAPSIHEAIHRAVDAGLAANGCALSTPPAFLVRARFTTRQQIAIHRHTEWGGAGAWPRARHGGGYGLWPVTPHTLTDVDQFTEGTVLLEFVDAATRRVVWRGEGAIVVGTAAENVRNVEEAITQLLRRFPPKARRAN